MAQRRMFSPQIVGSDAFLDMPISTQALYFHLGMYADDDGFINPKKIMRMAGASEDDIKILIAKRFVLPFENGVVVIKHWLINNLIQADRYHPTLYQEQKKLISIKENKAYTDSVNKMLPEVRLSKVRLGKEESRFAPPTLLEVSEYCKERNNGVNAQKFIDFYTSKGWMVGKNKMKDWKASVRTWEKDIPKTTEEKKVFRAEKPVTKEEIENRQKVIGQIRNKLNFVAN